MIELARIESRSHFRDRHLEAACAGRALTLIGSSIRRVLRGVLQQMRERRRRQPRIDLDLGVGRGVDANGSSLERRPHVRGRRIDDIGGRDPLTVGDDPVRVDSCHVENVLEEARQAVQFRQRRAHLLAPRFDGHRFLAEVLDGDPNGRQRRAQIVAQRREQCRREVGLLSHDLRCFALVQELHAFDRNRRHAGHGIERPEIHARRHSCKHTDGLDPVTQRNQRHPIACG